MLGREYPGDSCSAARALGIVGERWSLLILRDAMFRGLTQFAEFQQSLGLASNVLSSRLAAFVDVGLMRVEEHPSDTRRRVYRLTEMGMSLKPTLISLTEWGDRWLGNGPVVFVAEDGSEVSLRLTSAGGRDVSLAEVRALRRGAKEDSSD
jgi:DNA-binding HxlR family transcriptional regulator